MSNLLRKVFFDICHGYSSLDYKGGVIFVKHLSWKEYIDLEIVESQAFERAKASGLPDQKTQSSYLIKEGLWSEKKDTEIERQKSYLAQLNNNKKNIKLPSVLDSFLKQIKEADEKLKKLEREKLDLIGFTCESYATKIVNDYYICKSLFQDQNLKIPLLSEQRLIEEVEEDEISELISLYNKNIDNFSDKNIKKIALQDFFLSYFSLAEDDISSFYGSPIINLTFFQVKLANFGRFYKNILENNDLKNLSEDIKNDPDQLVDYVEAIKNGKTAVNSQKGDAVGVVGMTKKDTEMLGISNQVSSNPLKDLQEQVKHFKR